MRILNYKQGETKNIEFELSDSDGNELDYSNATVDMLITPIDGNTNGISVINSSIRKTLGKITVPLTIPENQTVGSYIGELRVKHNFTTEISDDFQIIVKESRFD